MTIGFAMCGSYCTYQEVLEALRTVKEEFTNIVPIMSENASSTDSRFGDTAVFQEEIRKICGREIIKTIPEAEPIGPKKLLDVLVVAPCTGNTLAKLANGITDTTVTMAVKSHLRNGRPVVIGVATNDGLSGSAGNIAYLLNKKGIFFVPFGQDDAMGKPTSLIADFSKINETIYAALEGRQKQPILL